MSNSNCKNEVSNDLYNQITADYKQSNSVRRTAQNCHVSMVTAQRILITAGLWSSKSSLQVQKMLGQDMTVDQIADELSLTRDAVYAYMPYSRGMYGVEQTDDSRYSKDYRERMETAAEGMRKNAADSISMSPDLSNLRFDPADTEQLTDQAREGAVSGDTHGEYGTVYALHLSLVGGFVYGAEDDMGLSPQAKTELFKLAKAESSISRDILVPGEMNLHALHYAIQKLFGWQNSHLHNYSVSQADFEKLTSDSLGGYTDLCGVLFRFPDDDLSDIYWDDDYEKGVSVKTWLRRKYSSPFCQYSVGDSYLGNQWEIVDFRERFPEFADDTALKEILNKVAIEQDFNYLIERLTVRELFALDGAADKDNDVRGWKGDVVGKLELLKEDLEDEEIYGTAEEMKKAAMELRNWRQSFDQIDHMLWVHPNTYRKDIERAYRKPYDEVVKMHKEQIEAWTAECMFILRDLNINLSPYFETLYYLYDYGDDWCIKITVEEIYRRMDDGSFVNNDMCRVAEDLVSVLTEVSSESKPVCMAADGLNLVDDCGGIHGYLDMLRTINGEDKEKAKEMKEWARGLGWTGRKSKPENML